MKWPGYFPYMLSVCLIVLGLSQWFPSTIKSELTKDWVVRFSDDISLDNIRWPDGLNLVSLHAPIHCAVIQSSLSEDDMRAILEPLDRTYFLSAARKDAWGSPIYPTGSVILVLDQEIDATQIAQLLHCDIEQYLEQLHWITVRIPQGEHYASFRNRCL